MRFLVLIGVLLVVFGIVSLGYQGINYVSREKVVDVGPIEVYADRERTIWLSPIVGGAAIVAGLVFVGMGARSRPA